jgi:hypothetical protein
MAWSSEFSELVENDWFYMPTEQWSHKENPDHNEID